MLSTLGGMERWRYVVVGPELAGEPPAKRDGWGSARGLRSDWFVCLTPAGRKAQEIWQPLFDEIERRWEERFGADTIAELRGSLEAIIGRLDVQLPEYLPIVGSSNGMAAGLSPLEERGATVGDGGTASRLHLPALLSQVLLAYTINFEEESELSLPLSANFVRVLDERRVPIRELPVVAGVPKEATSMALTFLAKTGYVLIEAKQVRLTPKGRQAQESSVRLHDGVAGRRSSPGPMSAGSGPRFEACSTSATESTRGSLEDCGRTPAVGGGASATASTPRR